MKNIYFFIFFINILYSIQTTENGINYNGGNDEWECSIENQSPINIKFYEFLTNNKNGVFTEEIPTVQFIKTYYPPLNGEELDNNLEMDINDKIKAKAFIKYKNISCIYDAKKLRLHIFSEHTFDDTKNDIEIQIMHKKEINSKSICPENLGISIFFSTQNNKKSKVINRFYKVNEDEKTNLYKRYVLSKVSSIELDKYTNDKTGYFWYIGSGTFPSNYPFGCNDEVYWILFKKVRDMSDDELRGIIASTLKIYPNGNARSTGKDDKKRDNTEKIKVYYNDKFE
jgi:carbonic anhydrase